MVRSVSYFSAFLDTKHTLKVRFFASQEDGLIGQMRWEFCGPFISSCKRLLRWVTQILLSPKLKWLFYFQRASERGASCSSHPQWAQEIPAEGNWGPRPARWVILASDWLTRVILTSDLLPGMVGTSDEKLMNLHDALKLEFEKVQRSYIGALEQLETLALVNTKVNNKGQMNGFGSKAPIAQSHQRQLSLKAGVDILRK